jgi:MoaA/NifB/PqqE/SkfB family radical SAM enzyme
MSDDFPRQVRIENTNLCNARCTMCPREQLTRGRGTMSLEFFKKLAEQLHEGGARELHLQGYGEPLLDNSIFDKIRFAKEVEIPYTLMVTNASLLKGTDFEELIQSGLDKLKISFYGTDKESYERIHAGLSYKEVKKNVLRLLETKKRLGAKKPVIKMKYIGSKESSRHITKHIGNIKYIGAVMKYAMNIPEFLSFFIQWGFRTNTEFARPEFHNYGYGKDFARPRTANRNRSCPMVEESVMQILWDGLVVPCCYDFDGRMVLGDLNGQSVEDVWRGPRYAKFREIHKNRQYGKLPVCLNCDKLR